MGRARVLSQDAAVSVSAWPWSLPEKRKALGTEAAGEVIEFDAQAAEESASSPPNAHPDPLRANDQSQRTFEEGFAEGKAATEQRLRVLFDDLGRAIVAVKQSFNRMCREAEIDQVAIALAVARRILHREVHIDPDALHGLVASAMAKIHPYKTLRVFADPSLKAGLIRALKAIPGGEDIEVDGDPALSPGTVRFETPRGILDASLETQLKEIEHGLVDRLERR